MLNNYFGKIDNSFILYIDPINLDIINFSRSFTFVHCNEIIFDRFEDNCQNNTRFSVNSFVEKIKMKTITEFDLIFDNNIHIQNVWWNDLLIKSELSNLEKVLNEIKKSIPNDEISKLDTCIQSPNYYYHLSNKITKQKVSPNSFTNFIKNSDRYQDKERKFF